MAKKIIRAASVQTKPIESSVEDTIFHAIKIAKKAAEREVDIICLPEHWLPEKVIPAPFSPLPALQSLAEEYGVVVVGGAFYEKVKGLMRLSSPVIGENGEIIGRQFKVHLFRFERKHAKPGNSYQIFQLKGYKIGILVCYDVDFPEPSRIYALNGAELILCPSRIVKPGITPWRQYVTVRCLENRMPIVAPNVYAPPWFDGHSMIISLREEHRTKISFPRIASVEKKGEGIVVQDIDLSIHNRLRKERFADRRPETYNQKAAVIPARKIEAVVFDLDNTLLRSLIGARRALLTVAKLVSHQLAKNGYQIGYVRLFEHLQRIDHEMLGRKFRYNRDLWWKTLFKELGLKRMDSEWIHDLTLQYWNVYAANSPPFRDAEPTVRKVKLAGYKLGMVSDSDGTPGMKRKRIRQVPFHDLFGAIVVSGEDTPRVKPGHESFNLVAKKLRVQPKSCVYVGDNPRTDIEGAKAVGMISVIVQRRKNRGGAPDYRIPNLRALPGLVKSIQRTH